MPPGMLTILAVLLHALPTLTIAAPVVVESLDQPPSGWEEVSSPAPDKLIKLSIGLESDNHELFERTLYEVSDPSHPSYGKHLSREEAKALLNPRQEVSDSVKRWLTDAGVPRSQVQDDGPWLHIRTTVSEAENLLSTRFGVFARDEEQVVRTREYSVPAEVRDHITTIQPTTFFGSAKKTQDVRRSVLDEKKAAKRGGGSGSYVDLNQCKTVVTPACLRKLYELPSEYPKSYSKTPFGILGVAGQTAQYDELEEFLRRFAPDQKGANFSEALVNGGKNPQGKYPSAEANLDIQYAVSLAYKVPVQFISVGGENRNFISDLDLPSETFIEPWLEFATYLLNLPDKKLPHVISISYGENEQNIPKAYAKQVCNMFGQLGTRGVSIISGSGDQGPGISCMSNDGKNTTKFLPSWPSACPYVTSVGGTESNSPEVAWESSSGGFSDYWPRPAWQDKAIKKYLNKIGDDWKGYYNKNGRGFPDIAALANGIQAINHGELESTGGTSAASPIAASVFALLNNERFKKGKPALGFLNPWIYKIGEEGFTDITKGKTEGCKGTSLSGAPAPIIPNAGWEAVKGWDPATGFGTPRFDCLNRLAT
ncbi:hypothetical protein G7046_g7379 [Stylonectria norvegica]|nr:hypothetical protein G7046_g7379 [Stylonectria norvegica]